MPVPIFVIQNSLTPEYCYGNGITDIQFARVGEWEKGCVIDRTGINIEYAPDLRYECARSPASAVQPLWLRCIHISAPDALCALIATGAGHRDG